jgi:hypothetical protein
MRNRKKELLENKLKKTDKRKSQEYKKKDKANLLMRWTIQVSRKKEETILSLSLLPEMLITSLLLISQRLWNEIRKWTIL